MKKAQERKKLENNQHMIKRLEKKITKSRPPKERFNVEHVNLFTKTVMDANFVIILFKSLGCDI